LRAPNADCSNHKIRLHEKSAPCKDHACYYYYYYYHYYYHYYYYYY